MDDDLQTVFTYGTLQTGERNFAKYMSEAKSLGRTKTLRAAFVLGHHPSATSKIPGKRSPGMVEIGEGGYQVEGELFKVASLDDLDKLEDIANGPYYRVMIELENGVKAWAYPRRFEDSYESSPHIHINEEARTMRWQEDRQPLLV